MSMMQNMVGWIDERFPLTKVWNEHLAQYYAPKNFNFWYFFGSLAILLAMVGIYGVMSWVVGQRTGEFGIRMAMGARGRDVVTMLLGQIPNVFQISERFELPIKIRIGWRNRGVD